MLILQRVLRMRLQLAYLSTHTVHQHKILLFFIILGGYGLSGKWIQENIIFMRFCCFKLSKKIEKLSNEQLMNAIGKCTLAGLVQYAKKLHQK